ncbi:MAG: YIP1 family protein [Acidobacteriia bacterium]|nr:YIP1 family protein [Terriglobia bacterium]
MSQEIPGSTSPVSAEPTKSPLERIIGVFFSPKATFEDINRKPDWIVPLVLLLVLGVVAVYVYFLKVDVGGLMLDQIQRAGQPEPPEDRLNSIVKVTKIFYYAGAIVLTPVIALISSGILFAVTNFIFGAETTFKKVFSVRLYADMVFALRTLLAIPVLFVRQPTELGDPSDVVLSNLAWLFPSENKIAHAFGKTLDLFWVWYIIVLGIGLVAVSKKLAFKKALIGPIILWGIFTLFVVVSASFKK